MGLQTSCRYVGWPSNGSQFRHALGIQLHGRNCISAGWTRSLRRFSHASPSTDSSVETTSSRLEDLRLKLKNDKRSPVRLPPRSFFVRTEKSRKRSQEVTVDMMNPIDDSVKELSDLDRVRQYGQGRTYFIESLGCQMNAADSEIVSAVLEGHGYIPAESSDGADAVFLNTCAIREGAEERAIMRLHQYRAKMRKDGQLAVLGCMAERMKQTLLERNLAEVVVGPDAYRDLPVLLCLGTDNRRAMNVALSQDETYADIKPVRRGSTVHAWVSITRGCNNMCSYCIVPYTRGRERSRPVESILREVEDASKDGYKEVTLLGQNVNSYFDKSARLSSGESQDSYSIATGFSENFKSTARRGSGVRFGDLLELVAGVDPNLRVRFTSPHPKDFTDDVLEVIAKYDNISKGIHLPAQSGSDSVLERMRRGYTKEAYLSLVRRARAIIGSDLEFSSDFISGFCGESEEDHQETLSLMEEVRFTECYMFAYSERERTKAYHQLNDDVPEEVKLRRLSEVIATYRSGAVELAKEQIGKRHRILIEGPSKRNPHLMKGKTEGLRRCVVHGSNPIDFPPGTYCEAEVFEANIATLHGRLLSATD